ncbi:glycosyltransferase family 2 protein [Paenibacillus alvei]|uniref:glycosyltransferase family 2 protein n=1 Tax=Paenibacillus alvei TaxID=44250 RepID=UPI000385CC41|nr:glycosyltransferase [Paenibacillus alvei]EPY09451.1 family 2 glycosyl transferase [Paenibacillus alvei A6-6i-x]
MVGRIDRNFNIQTEKKQNISPTSYLISLIIPSYNYGAFLSEAIESALKQTVMPHEIIILDDFSNDNTEEIGKMYESKFPNLIKFHRNPRNMGIVDNFNNGVSLSNGDLICFLGADNIFDPRYIEKTSEILIKNDNVAIAYTDFILFGERAKVVYESFLAERRGPIIDGKYYTIVFPDFDFELLKEGNYIHGSSMYKRQAFEQVGGYRSKDDLPEDYNLFYRIVSAGWYARRVPEPLLEYRQHSTEQANIKNIARAEFELYKKQNNDLKAIISSRDKDIEELKGVIAHRDKDIEELKGVIAHRDRDIKEIMRVIAHRDKDIEELKGVIAHRDKDIEELKGVIAHRDKDIEKLKDVIAHRDREIEEQKIVIKHRDLDIETLNGEIIRRDKNKRK